MRSLSESLSELLSRVPELAECQEALATVAAAMSDCARDDRVLFFCGNGGSCADAEHIVGEFLKSFEQPRPLPAAEQAVLRQAGAAGAYLADRLQVGIRAVALSAHPSFTTAMANDVAWDVVFAQQVYALGRPGDLLLGITTSGNSANVIYAVEAARARGLRCFGLTGRQGGRLASRCDACIRAPAERTARVQEFHQQIYHWLCAAVEEHLFSSK